MEGWQGILRAGQEGPPLRCGASGQGTDAPGADKARQTGPRPFSNGLLKSFSHQREIFYRLFPRKIDSGLNKPDTFEWILGRTKDGTGSNAPRELIHFSTEIRDEQIRRLERGESLPQDDLLFDRSIFKAALKAVSETRLNQTFLAEYPELRPFVVSLQREKTLQSVDTLSKIWKLSRDETLMRAGALVAAGFFEARGTKEAPEYWVPFLYRDALEMVQGTAD